MEAVRSVLTDTYRVLTQYSPSPPHGTTNSERTHFNLYFTLIILLYCSDAGELIADPFETYLLEDVHVQDLFNEFETLINGKLVDNRKC